MIAHSPRLLTGAVALATALAGAAPASGQQRDCTPTASLGIGQWVVHNGSVTTEADGTVRYRFRTEPIVGGVRAGGPAVGRLREGDVLVAVDGALITTPEGWSRLERIEPGDRVTIGVRRDGREIDVTIVADRYCRSLRAPAPPSPVRPARAIRPVRPVRPPRAPRVEVAPLPAPPAPAAVAVGPGAYFGFSFQCSQCVGRLAPRDRETPPSGAIQWEFTEPPVLKAVTEGGPAWEAGLRSGDTLLEIDGTSITTRQGWERFSTVEPDRPVKLTVDRRGTRRTFTVVPKEYPVRLQYVTPGALAVPLAPDAPRVVGYAFADEDSPLRYSDVLGGVAVEVRGEPANTFYDAEKGELIIRAAGTWIRLKLTDPDR